MSLLRKATHVIKHLRLGEVSLVPDGDNPEAHVIIVKSRDNVSDIAREGIEEIRKAAEQGDIDMDELNARLAEIEKALTDAEGATAIEKARADAAEARVTALEADIEKARTDAAAAGGEEDIFKGITPAARARIEQIEKGALASAAALAAITEQREADTFIVKARDYGVGKPEDVGGIMHRISKGKTTEADVAAVETLLKQAATLAAAGQALFKNSGTGGDGEADPEALLKAAAETIQKAKPLLTYQAAYAEAMDANPGLYDAIMKAKRAA